jgi:hypothetical protein
VETLDDMRAVVLHLGCTLREWVLEMIQESVNEPSTQDSLHVGNGKLPKLLRSHARVQTERVGTYRVGVEEDPDEHERENKVQLLFAEDATRVLFRLKRKREDIGCKMDLNDISDAELC